MKLLLTSAGISNKTIATSLEKLVGKSPQNTKVAVINTAAMVQDGEKNWYINQYIDLKRFGYSWIDIVDISNPLVDWKARLQEVDIIYVGGGNTFYLLDQMRKQSFDTWAEEFLEDKVYVGVSAGTICVTPSIAVANIEPPDDNIVGITDLTGLGWVEYEISPHTPESLTYESNELYAQTTQNTVYALDDKSAIEVNGHEVSLISEGDIVIYNG